jgi:predicted dienelactone hydrolase
MLKSLTVALLLGVSALPACAALPAPAPVQSDQAAVVRDFGTLDAVWRDAARSRDVPVRIYLPSGQDRAPVVIVSHGLGGSREGLAYMGRALAAHGYIAVHVQHAGSDTDAVFGGGRPGMQNLGGAARDPAVAANRFADVPFAVSELMRLDAGEGPLQGRVDGERIAVLGHSFGAITAMAIAGQSFPGGQTVRDPRIDVAVALSPSPPRQGTSAEAYGAIDIPVLMFTGTADTTPLDAFPVERRQEPYGVLSRAYRMLVVFDGADHAVFGGRARGAPQPSDAAIQGETVRITVAFLDRFLRAEPARLETIEGTGSNGLRASGVLRYAD